LFGSLIQVIGSIRLDEVIPDLSQCSFFGHPGTRLFKAVYEPQRQEAGAYLIDNTAGAKPQEISVSELEKMAIIYTTM